MLLRNGTEPTLKHAKSLAANSASLTRHLLSLLLALL